MLSMNKFLIENVAWKGPIWSFYNPQGKRREDGQKTTEEDMI